jgi:L-asparaginase/Glu-tRNA(Gln) amidotransferase subunit D
LIFVVGGIWGLVLIPFHSPPVGIFLVFDGDIILGARAHKMSESKLDAFTPINWGLLGEIRIDIRFSEDAKRRHDRPLQFLPGTEQTQQARRSFEKLHKLTLSFISPSGFDCNIAVYTIFPGFCPKELTRIIERDDIRGIILASYGSGNVSWNSSRNFCRT